VTESEPEKDAIYKRFKELKAEHDDVDVKGISWHSGHAGKFGGIRYKKGKGWNYVYLRNVEDVDSALKTAIKEKD
jgi:hypothetical protein